MQGRWPGLWWQGQCPASTYTHNWPHKLLAALVCWGLGFQREARYHCFALRQGWEEWHSGQYPSFLCSWQTLLINGGTFSLSLTKLWILFYSGHQAASNVGA